MFDRPTRRAVWAAMALSALLRLRFVWTPLSADEGGYMAIGRAWFGGDMLYRDHWIDRPQALLATFGGLDLLTGGGPAWIRVLAIVIGALGVLGAAMVAAALSGDDPARQRRAAILAATVVAVLSSVAQFEGFIANGELLGGSLAVLAAGIAMHASRRARPAQWFVGAGVVGGLAMSMRQTSLDGLVLIALVGLFTTIFGPWVHLRARALLAVAGGAAAVLGIQIAHGMATDAQAWFYCMWGYRSEHRDIGSADWPRFWRTFAVARPILGPVVVVIVAAVVLAVRRGQRASTGGPRWAILGAWLAVVLVMFAWGGQFYRHYWVMVAFPIGVIAGVALSTVRPARLAWAGVALCTVSPLAHTGQLIVAPRHRVMAGAHEDGRLIINEHVAAWYNARKVPGDSLAVLCGSAAVYALTDTDPPISPIWVAALKEADGAVAAAAATLRGDGPSYVAKYGVLTSCDIDRQLTTALDQFYVSVGNVDGVTMMARRSSPGGR